MKKNIKKEEKKVILLLISIIFMIIATVFTNNPIYIILLSVIVIVFSLNIFSEKFKTIMFIFFVAISLIIGILYYNMSKDFNKYCEKRSDKMYYCEGWDYDEHIKNNIEKYCNLLNLDFYYPCQSPWSCPSDQYYCSKNK